MSEKLTKNKKIEVIVEATWTGPFPLALMASEGATIYEEVNSRRVEDSLAPFIGEHEATIKMVKYVDKHVTNMQMIDGQPYFGLNNWDIRAWNQEGVTLKHLDARKVDTRKYKQFLRVKFTQFPLDMLRYDRAYPATQKDAASIAASISNVDRTMREVVVVKLTEAASDRMAWGFQRWDSYSYVIAVDPQKKLSS